MIKVLGICASPRNGNSKYLLEEALKASKEVSEEVVVEYTSIKGKKISGCVMCQACEKDGICVIKDDFQKLAEQWIASDVVLYSVPVYHMGMPAQLKAFVDRLGNSFFGRYADEFSEDKGLFPRSLRNLKVIGTIAQGIHIFSGQEHTITQMINHAMIMGCVPVTGDMWEAYIGAGGWTNNEVGRSSIEKQIKEGNEDALATFRATRSIAKRAVEMSMILKNGGNQNKVYLEKTPVYKPFIDRLD